MRLQAHVNLFKITSEGGRETRVKASQKKKKYYELSTTTINCFKPHLRATAAVLHYSINGQRPNSSVISRPCPVPTKEQTCCEACVPCPNWRIASIKTLRRRQAYVFPSKVPLASAVVIQMDEASS